MNARRWITGLLLGSLLLGQSLPATAGRMLCGMKERPTVEACTRCDGDQATPSGGSLRAGTCCRIGPAEAAESTPVVLNGGQRRIEGGDRQVVDAVLPAASGVNALSDNARALLAGPTASPPLLESPTRTTVLRN